MPRSPTLDTDEETRHFRTLVAELQAGSQQAAWTLVQRYEPHVRAVVRRHLSPSLRVCFDSEDFVQAAWASLLRIAPRLRNIERPSQLVALLARIARNKVIDEHRRLQRRGGAGVQPREGRPAPEPMARGAPPSEVAIARERWERLLAAAPPLHRRILKLRLAGETYAAIAQRLNLHERSVRRIVGRLLRLVKD